MNPAPRWLGWLLLASLGWHAYDLARTTSLWELAWSCHLATVLMALGMFFRARLAVATAWLFHLSIGLPAWLIAIVITRGTFGAEKADALLLVTSTLVHVLPIIFGAMWLRRDFALGWHVAALAWLLPSALIPITRLFTPPEWNINLAHGVWPSVAPLFPRLWLFQATICAACAASVTIVMSGLGFLERKSQIASHK